MASGMPNLEQIRTFVAIVDTGGFQSAGDRPAAIHPGLLEMRDRTVFTPHLGSAVDRARLIA